MTRPCHDCGRETPDLIGSEGGHFLCAKCWFGVARDLRAKLEAAEAERNDAIKRLHYALGECERLRESLRPLVAALEEANAYDSRCLSDLDYANLERARAALEEE